MRQLVVMQMAIRKQCLPSYPAAFCLAGGILAWTLREAACRRSLLSSQEFTGADGSGTGCHLLTASECVEKERGLCRLLRKAANRGAGNCVPSRPR